MNILRNIGLVIITVLIAAIVPTLILLNVIHNSIFEENLITETMEEVGVYEIVSEVIVDELRVSKEDYIYEDSQAYAYDPNLVEREAEIYVNTINDIIENNITPKWIESKFEAMEEDVLFAIQGEDSLEYKINISSLKETVLEDFDNEIEYSYYNEQYYEDFKYMLTGFPSEVSVKDKDQIERIENAISEMENYYYEYDSNKVWGWVAVVALFLGALAIAFFAKSLLRWSGIIVSVTGASILLYFVLVNMLPTLIYAFNIKIPDAGIVQSADIEYGISYMTDTIAEKFFTLAITVFGIGIVILAASFIPNFIKKGVNSEEAA